MNLRYIALLAALMTSVIYGISFTVSKEVMPEYIKPFGFIVIRVVLATVLFWIAGIFAPKQKIERKDFIKIATVSFFGIALNMLAFFKGLSYTSPISGSVIMIISPILVLIMSAVILKERLIKRRILGIFVGLGGALLLGLYGNSNDTDNPDALLGNFLVFVNAASYSYYFILAKPLITKYNPVNFAKWLYLFGSILVIPFGFMELTEVDWSLMQQETLLNIGFVVLFTTFCTYLFNLFALTKLKATTVSVFVYMQPIFASIYAISQGKDSLNTAHIFATLLIFGGVILVSLPPKKTTNTISTDK